MRVQTLSCKGGPTEKDYVYILLCLTLRFDLTSHKIFFDKECPSELSFVYPIEDFLKFYNPTPQDFN